ncbi:MAG: TRAP transporter substrate-binding protein [Solimonas sp.]
MKFRTLAFLLAAAPLAASAQNVMKLGTATLNDSQHEWMKRYAAMVDADSKGRIKVEIYPLSQLGPIPRMIEQTQFGAIQGWVGPPEFLSGVDIRYEVLSAPGLFKDMAHANRVLQDPKFNAAFLALGADKGLKGLGLFISGPAAFVARKPLRSVADLAGLKIRVLAAPLQMEQIRALKATPVPMPLGEVMPALQQGTLDSVMSCIPVFYPLKYYSVAKYLLATEHALLSSATVISRKWFDALPPDLQKLVVDSGRKVSEGVYQWSVDDVKNGYEAWVKAGGEIVRLDPKAQEALMAQLLPLGAEVTSKKPEEKALFDLLQDAVKRTR